MGAYTHISGYKKEGKRLRVTVTLTNSDRPYKKLRYFTVQTTGSEKKFNQAYQAYRKMFDKIGGK